MSYPSSAEPTLDYGQSKIVLGPHSPSPRCVPYTISHVILVTAPVRRGRCDHLREAKKLDSGPCGYLSAPHCSHSLVHSLCPGSLSPALGALLIPAPLPSLADNRLHETLAGPCSPGGNAPRPIWSCLYHSFLFSFSPDTSETP